MPMKSAAVAKGDTREITRVPPLEGIRITCTETTRITTQGTVNDT